MFKHVIFSILLTLPILTYSAAPVTHIYFAELYLNICKPNYTKKEKDSFMLGTLFPDIRYIASLPRTKTHVSKITLETIIGTSNPFKAGKLFHSFVDNTREKITEKQEIVKVLQKETLYLLPQKHYHTFIKIVEDEWFFNKIKKEAVRDALLFFDPQEKRAEIPFAIIKDWHRYLRDYLRQSPTLFLRKSPSEFFGKKKQKESSLAIAQGAPLIEKFAKNKKMIAYFTTLTNEFTKIFKATKESVHV